MFQARVSGDVLVLWALLTCCRIVERVVLHLVEPPPPDAADGLRVFVVFSGIAGAWRATRELDGRFFAGQKIVSWSMASSTNIQRARYFDGERFNRGERDGDY
jgi:splicing factor 45